MRAQPFLRNIPRRTTNTLYLCSGVFMASLVAFFLSYYQAFEYKMCNGEMSNENKDLLTKDELPLKSLYTDLSIKVKDLERRVKKSKVSGLGWSDEVDIPEQQKDILKYSAGPVEEIIKEVVKSELSIYDSDKTGITDYALENLGGKVLSIRDTATYADGSATMTIFGIPIMTFEPTNPNAILQPSMTPGSCWAFQGDRGRVVIQLMTEIIVTAITLEHIPQTLSPTRDISSAPKEIELYGLQYLNDNNPHYFGKFTYKEDGPTVQTYNVEHPSNRPYCAVEVVIKSNHGNKLFTCVYRVRIHGKVPEGD